MMHSVQFGLTHVKGLTFNKLIQNVLSLPFDGVYNNWSHLLALLFIIMSVVRLTQEISIHWSSSDYSSIPVKLYQYL